MGKSIRSKIKKRLRTVKRQRVDAMLITPREHEKHDRLVKVSQGRGVTLSKPRNAFKYPDNDDAAFPQHEVVKPIDFRAQNLPMAGTAFRGNRRKYSPEEAEMLNHVIKTSHPKMEVLAGGGAIMAKTGKKVSLEEAELLATKINRPEIAALAESGPPSASSAVEAAVAEDSAVPSSSSRAPASEDDEDMDEDVAEPDGSADTSRRPVVKDARRAKRTAEHRSRPNSVKKAAKKQKASAPAIVAAKVPVAESQEEHKPEAKKNKKHAKKNTGKKAA